MWTTRALSTIPPCHLLPNDHARYHDGHVLNRGTRIRALNLSGFKVNQGDDVTMDHVTLPSGRRIPVIVARQPKVDGDCLTCTAKCPAKPNPSTLREWLQAS